MLDRVPTETLSLIASYLCDYKDLKAFASVCQETVALVRYDPSLWRILISKLFDVPISLDKMPLADRRLVYCHRMKLNESIFDFEKGARKVEKRSVWLLRTLILEARPSDDASMGSIACMNQGWIKSFAYSHRLFANCQPSLIYDGLTGELLAMRVALSYLRFESRRPFKSRRRGDYGVPYCIDNAQAVVHAAPCEQLLFTGYYRYEVNLRWVLNAVNLWHYYLTSPPFFSDIQSHYEALPPSKKIQPPTRRVQSGHVSVGKSYLGEYCSIDPKKRSLWRESQETPKPINDYFRGFLSGEEPTFQSLNITLLGDGNVKNEKKLWPAVFERHLNGAWYTTPRDLLTAVQTLSATVPEPRLVRNCGGKVIPSLAEPDELPEKIHHRQFIATGCDHGEPFFGTGWITALPDQEGMSGFSRFTMAKFFPHAWSHQNDADIPNPPSAKHIHEALKRPEEGAIYCYEGVMLPGGNMIVGRWFLPALDDYAGIGLGLNPFGEQLDDDDEFFEPVRNLHEDMEYGPFIFWETGGTFGGDGKVPSMIEELYVRLRASR